ncbi:MAG: inositol monophosphatase [Chromatiales bacterium]|nr:inositol monophosphatase [Chromatiales bacterium]
MSSKLNIAKRAALAAGSIIAQSANFLSKINIKHKAVNNPVSSVDLACEQEIIRIIQKAYPQHSIVAEESGLLENDREWQWVIDPLDGTANFIRGIPHCAVSIALKHKEFVILGVIYDPFKNELFLAEKGEGATLNQRKIRVSEQTHLAGAMLGTGLPFRLDQNIKHDVKVLSSLLKEKVHIRRKGAAALDLAYVACGRFDGFWEFGLAPWDIAAGEIIIREAGGLVAESNGGLKHLSSGNVVAANAKLFKTILAKISSLKSNETI